jgi:hypothetical protein
MSALLLALAAVLLGCGEANMASPEELNESYERALARTAGQATTFAGDPAREAAALEALGAYFADMSAASIRARTREVYAPEAYLNDNLAAVEGAAAIEDYFSIAASRADRIAVEFADVSRSDRDYYVRWRMTIVSSRLNDGEPMVSLGVTHFRLDADGRILVHKDFWDAGTGLYEYLPVVGALVRFTRSRVSH